MIQRHSNTTNLVPLSDVHCFFIPIYLSSHPESEYVGVGPDAILQVPGFLQGYKEASVTPLSLFLEKFDGEFGRKNEPILVKDCHKPTA